MAGTSTGGILALGLGLGLSGAELLDFYRREGPRIFPALRLTRKFRPRPPLPRSSSRHASPSTRARPTSMASCGRTIRLDGSCWVHPLPQLPRPELLIPTLRDASPPPRRAKALASPSLPYQGNRPGLGRGKTGRHGPKARLLGFLPAPCPPRLRERQSPVPSTRAHGEGLAPRHGGPGCPLRIRTSVVASREAPSAAPPHPSVAWRTARRMTAESARRESEPRAGHENAPSQPQNGMRS